MSSTRTEVGTVNTGVSDENQRRTVIRLAADTLGQYTNDFLGWLWRLYDTSLDTFRDGARNFFAERVATFPVVGRWAERIGSGTSDIIFAVLRTTSNFLRVAITSRDLWSTVHNAALVAWNANAPNGLLAQSYAYAKKMASLLLEVLMQCLEKAIKAHNMNVNENDRENIRNALENAWEQHEQSNKAQTT